LDRKEKEKIITGLKERLGKACGTFLVDYQGLNVDELTKLRRELRKKGIEFQVVKNRLLLIASQDTEADILRDYLAGPCALAITYDDVVTPAKVLTKFMQDYEALEIKIGQINGKLVELSAIKRLAQLPSKEVLLSQLLFSLSSVPASFVRTLSEMLRRLVTVLEAIKGQKE
jgi:large subunit ribosomal protein L10